MDKKIKFVMKESEEPQLNEQSIEVEVPGKTGNLRKVKIDAMPMMHFLIDNIFN